MTDKFETVIRRDEYGNITYVLRDTPPNIGAPVQQPNKHSTAATIIAYGLAFGITSFIALGLFIGGVFLLLLLLAFL